MSAPFVPVDLERIAEVIDDLGRRIDILGAELCSDPAIISAHMERLQDIDRISQHLCALGKMLRAECMTTAAKHTGLDELIDRLLPGHRG
jgi:DNA-binding phage protein